jgi:hypothetical protein
MSESLANMVMWKKHHPNETPFEYRERIGHVPTDPTTWGPIETNPFTCPSGVTTAYACGCRIVGEGTLPYPLSILWCDMHKGARKEPEVWGFWTEHEIGPEGSRVDSSPLSSEVTQERPGRVLYGCGEEVTCFVLRGHYPSYEAGKEAFAYMHSVMADPDGWETWLAEWKTKTKGGGE